jgi:2-dehydro-3-deoxy-D-arabinonate dehydratase
VTYERKKDSIIEEARVGGDFYDDVFDSARPQMFFKSTPHRTVGPNDSIYIRHDSQWTVPEPELALLVSPALEVVGYTCGNDVSARDIEGENPLYIQQAKTYLGSCALGPVIAVPETAGEIPPVEISMVVIRDGMTLFQGETSTAEMTRGFAELVDYLADANSFPGGAFLLTGCGVVPPAEFALEIDDVVEITMSGVGTLRTTVDQHRELPDGPEDREG